MTGWRKNLLNEVDDIRKVLERSKRIAVLGIKPESRSDAAAFYVPEYLQRVGYDVIPVPVYYPDVTEILGKAVYRSLRKVPQPVDVVDVFRKPEDIPDHLEDLIALNPKVVWFQLGIAHGGAAEALARAGIQVVQNRCILADHRVMFS